MTRRQQIENEAERLANGLVADAGRFTERDYIEDYIDLLDYVRVVIQDAINAAEEDLRVAEEDAR